MSSALFDLTTSLYLAIRLCGQFNEKAQDKIKKQARLAQEMEQWYGKDRAGRYLPNKRIREARSAS